MEFERNFRVRGKERILPGNHGIKSPIYCGCVPTTYGKNLLVFKSHAGDYDWPLKWKLHIEVLSIRCIVMALSTQQTFKTSPDSIKYWSQSLQGLDCQIENLWIHNGWNPREAKSPTLICRDFSVSNILQKQALRPCHLAKGTLWPIEDILLLLVNEVLF